MSTAFVHYAAEQDLSTSRRPAHILDRFDHFEGGQIACCGAKISTNRKITVPRDRANGSHFYECPNCLNELEARMFARQLAEL